MVANLTTLNAALKEFYVSPITTQLNEEIDILNEFSKQSVSWSGSQAIFPIKTTRNTGVGYIDDGGNLPTAGNVGTERMVVTAMSLVSRFQITNKSLKSAKKGGAGAFIGALELEMDGAKEAAKNRANRMTTSGGHVVGFITAKLAPVGNAAANVAVPFFGDINKLRAVALAVEAAGQTLRVQVICNAPDLAGTGAGMALGNLSSYNPIGAVANDSCLLTSANVNIAAGTINLGDLVSAGTPDINTDAVPVGFGMAIKVNPTQANAAATAAVAAICGLEPEGLYGNIADETIHGLNRGNTGGTASTQTLQSHVLDMGAAAGAQTAISLDRIQQTFDRVMNTAGEEPDQIWISPLFRNQYTTLFSGAQEILSDANSSKKRADGGFSNISYAGIPMKTSRHVDNGMLIFIKRKHWKVAELSPIGFADEDGRIINKVQGSARIEGFLEWDYNLVCVRPNANAILTGLLR
ncbi:MAG: hypothetical protein CMI60_17285 [Parvibaculum sp.]|jgi:hypothetical protein|nr:hypothetical protein [Parvibaculum sp.]